MSEILQAQTNRVRHRTTGNFGISLARLLQSFHVVTPLFASGNMFGAQWSVLF
jgi:hypothetical protein